MTGKCGLTREHVARILGNESLEHAAQRLRPDMDSLPHVPAGSAKVSAERARALWDEIGGDPALREILLERAPDDLAIYQGNIENAIGLLRMPIGLAGPLRVNGMAAKGDYPIPLATTEAALVASYHRGCRLLTAAGGCTALVLYESLSRAPGFVFETAADACHFIAWAVSQFEEFKRIAESTTAHGRLMDLGCTVEGNHVYLNFEFTTGDASGQNMVTIATQAVCDEISSTLRSNRCATMSNPIYQVTRRPAPAPSPPRAARRSRRRRTCPRNSSPNTCTPRRRRWPTTGACPPSAVC
jgi:hydroxymethylglutaryl-CoA reductase (NADPH)